MNKMIKDALILFAITLVSGLGLGAVYNVTSGPERNRSKKQKMQLIRQYLTAQIILMNTK